MYTKQLFCLALAMITLFSCNQAQENGTDNNTENTNIESSGRQFIGLDGEILSAVSKSPEEWEQQLDSQAYYVLREAGTERAFSGKYWDNKKEGVYTCAGCGLPLFSSETKFRSGTGWPSFYEPIRAEHIIEKSDNSLGMTRVEILCARCNGHQGHVFRDGPEPTGLRYCINSVSLEFEEGAEFDDQP